MMSNGSDRRELRYAVHTYGLSAVGREEWHAEGRTTYDDYTCSNCGAMVSVEHRISSPPKFYVQSYSTYKDFCPAEWEFNSVSREYQRTPQALLAKRLREAADAHYKTKQARNEVCGIYTNLAKSLPVTESLASAHLNQAMGSLERALEELTKYQDSHKLPEEIA